MLWDTAGQEEFDAITAAYYRGAHACVLAYSATDRDSFDAIPSWKLKVHESSRCLSSLIRLSNKELTIYDQYSKLCIVQSKFITFVTRKTDVIRVTTIISLALRLRKQIKSELTDCNAL